MLKQIFFYHTCVQFRKSNVSDDFWCLLIFQEVRISLCAPGIGLARNQLVMDIQIESFKKKVTSSTNRTNEILCLQSKFFQFRVLKCMIACSFFFQFRVLQCMIACREIEPKRSDHRRHCGRCSLPVSCWPLDFLIGMAFQKDKTSQR